MLQKSLVNVTKTMLEKRYTGSAAGVLLVARAGLNSL
jgi:hypothetical protein